MVNLPLHLSPAEQNALSYLTGWIAFKLKNIFKNCKPCTEFLITSDIGDKNLTVNNLINIKSYGWLTFPSQTLQRVIYCAEGIFQANRAECLKSCNSIQLLMERSDAIHGYSNTAVPHCHDVVKRCLFKFYKIRSFVCADQMSKPTVDERQYASKSAKSRTTIK